MNSKIDKGDKYQPVRTEEILYHFFDIIKKKFHT